MSVAWGNAKVHTRDYGRLQATSAIIRRTWRTIFAKVSQARHGGTFLFVLSNTLPSPELIKPKYEINSPRLRDAIKARCSLEPEFSRHRHGKGEDLAVIEEAPFADRRLARMTDFAASLAAVDGAVLVAGDLTILAFGVEILSVKDDSFQGEIEFALHHGLKGVPPDIRSIASFGMRHRSAIRFCQQVPGSLAFVISQDGDVRLFAMKDGRLRAVEPTLEDAY
jgi:hypothetical protein